MQILKPHVTLTAIWPEMTDTQLQGMPFAVQFYIRKSAYHRSEATRHAQALSARAHTITGAHVVPQDPPARLYGWSLSQQLSHPCSRRVIFCLSHAWHTIVINGFCRHAEATDWVDPSGITT